MPQVEEEDLEDDMLDMDIDRAAAPLPLPLMEDTLPHAGSIAVLSAESLRACFDAVLS